MNPWLLEGLASLEAKRKFRAPKVTPKQQVLNGSLPSPRIEDSGTPDSIEDTSLPSNNIQVYQCSSEHFSSGTRLDDSINTASQCSSERVRCDIHRDDSASVSPQCSHDIGSDPAEDPDIEGNKVFHVSLLPYFQCSRSPTFLQQYRISVILIVLLLLYRWKSTSATEVQYRQALS